MQNIKLTSITSNYIKPLSPKNSVKEAMLLMKEKAISSVTIVNDQNKPIGIFTEHDALKVLAKPEAKNLLLESMMSKDVFFVSTDTYIHDAYILMEKRGYRHLILVDEDEKYVGLISEGDFLRQMGFEEVAKQKKIADAMSADILTITKNTTLTQTALLMTENKCDYAIIIENDLPIGIINERDITHYCSQNVKLKQNTIEAIEQKEMHSVLKCTTLDEATSLMSKHGVHQLIVLDENDKLLGLITRHDILKAIHSSYFDYLIETIENKTETQNELLKHQQELEDLATHDQLTSLPNRLYFQHYLQIAIDNAIEEKSFLSVLLLDLDRFKDINDSYGHTIGDELLKIIASRLAYKGNLVARLGGDEFAIILEHLTNEDEILTITKDILEIISKVSILSNGVDLQISSSIGIVIAPKDAKSVETVLQYADSALYQAKNDGRGVYRFYSNEMTKKSMQKSAYEHALRNAIQNGELELYYQPQVHIKTQRIISTEALLRWNHPKEGLISPVVFIPIAEYTGLINTIGEWVIDEACRQGKLWQEKGYNISIAVNVSPNQVRFQNIPLIISDALKKHNYPADKLEIEITESSLMNREEEVVEMLHSLRAKGITLAIDDFGTGYSSLSYLKRFPIDVLKIDKSFIDDIPYKKDDMAIVIAIIEMGKALGFEILAEGIEHQEQLDFLEQKGCHMYQGYIKSKPLKAPEFEKLLQEQGI